jgi:hypothetical protein
MCGGTKDIHMFTSTHNPPAEGNFCDEKGNVIGPHIVEDYNLQIVYVDKADTMTNSSSLRYLTWKCVNKLFFHLLGTVT